MVAVEVTAGNRHHDYYRRAVELQAEAAALFRRAAWSPVVPMIGYDDIDAALESDRLILSLGARWCEKCAMLLPELERAAKEPRFRAVGVFRLDLDASNPPGLALSRFPDPDGDTPPSDTGVYEHQIPVTIYFERGEEIRRGYGVIDIETELMQPDTSDTAEG